MTTAAVATYVIGDLAVILALSALLQALSRRLGQPSVIGQILLGVVLGPTVLGHLPGHLEARLFPASVVPYLTVLGQVAVVIFMFGVGYEMDRRALRGRGRAVALITTGALIVPLALGMGLVLALSGSFAGAGQPDPGRFSFVLFMGVVTAITALPVLASIVRERGLAGTTAGTVATCVAGIMDVAAWLLLAVAIAKTGHGGRPWPVTALLAVVLIAVMFGVVRPALAWSRRRWGALARHQVATAVVLALADAWVTARLGLQPVFGGLLAGLTVRAADGAQDPDVIRVLDNLGELLLPVFFVVAGLSLDIGGLHFAQLGLLALILLVASAGKLVPAYAGARLGGLPSGESATIAVLLNCRGMTEIVALTAGLTAGIIGRTVFTLMVSMALVTTAATALLLRVTAARTARTAARDGGQPGAAVPAQPSRLA